MSEQAIATTPSDCGIGEQVEHALRRVIGSVYSADNRRADHRYNITTRVTAHAIDPETGQPGEPIAMLTRNLSRGGASLLCDVAIREGELLLRFTTDAKGTPPLRLRVLRCRPAGRHFEVAGRFVTGA